MSERFKAIYSRSHGGITLRAMSEEAPPAPISAVRTDVTGKRIVAAIIDIVLLALLFIVMGLLFGDTQSSSGDDGSSVEINLSGGPFIAYVVLSFAYYFVLELITGQTIGKKIMKLRVAMLNGSPLAAGPVAIRTVLRIIDGLPVLYLVGFISIVASKEKQRIGDMAAGTVVVEA
jgi:uncharacterized RDD family membrane protein YckC